MFLGKERRDRTVALVLAASLVAIAVLGLLVTLASQGSGAGRTSALPYGATPSPSTDGSPAAAAPTPRPAAVSQMHAHGDLPPIQPGGVGVGHPGRLVGMLIGVVLIFAGGLMVVHEQRRREGESDASDGQDEWIS